MKTKLSWLTLALFIGGLTFGAQSVSAESPGRIINTCAPQTSCETQREIGFQLMPYQGSTGDVPMRLSFSLGGSDYCDTYRNTVGQSYFIPTATRAEYESFRNSVSVWNPEGTDRVSPGRIEDIKRASCGCGDRICEGGAIENCGTEDDLEPSPETGDPMCNIDCGACPVVCGDGFCAAGVEHCTGGVPGAGYNPCAECGPCGCLEVEDQPWFDCTGQCGSCGWCSPCCGDNNQDAGEQCDQTDLNGQTCNDFVGLTEPALSCTSSCLFDITGCTPLACIVDGFCDSGAGENCTNCLADCQLPLQNTSACFSGDRYWYDACNNRGAIRENCGGNGCIGDVCQAAPVTGVCDERTRNGCVAGTPNDAAADSAEAWRWRCHGSGGGANSRVCLRCKDLPESASCGAVPSSRPNQSRTVGCPTGFSGNCFLRCNRAARGYIETSPSTCVAIVNGVCNNSTRNACVSGTPNDGAIADTATRWRWRCDGSGGGSNSGVCSKAIPVVPVNGVCDERTQNGCVSGTPNDAAADSAEAWRWRCHGTGGGTHSGICLRCKDLPESASCGAVPSSRPNQSRTVGCPTGFSGNCFLRCNRAARGYIETSPSTCVATVNGVCNNSTRNACVSGTPNDGVIADTATRWRWRCDGTGGGSNSRVCSKRIPVVPVTGVCNEFVRNGCSAGAANDAGVPDTAQAWRWRCHGTGGGANSGICIRCKNLPEGFCAAVSSTTPNQRRTVGCPTGFSGNCFLECDRATEGYISFSPPTCVAIVNGVCNNSTRNACVSGTPNDGAFADTPTQWQWRCDGTGGGSNSGMCSKVIPAPQIIGACNESFQNGCFSGTPNNGAFPDTAQAWRWRCDGSGGGANSGLCVRCKNLPQGFCAAVPSTTPNQRRTVGCPTGFSGNCFLECSRSTGGYISFSPPTCAATPIITTFDIFAPNSSNNCHTYFPGCRWVRNNNSCNWGGCCGPNEANGVASGALARNRGVSYPSNVSATGIRLDPGWTVIGTTTTMNTSMCGKTGNRLRVTIRKN